MLVECNIDQERYVNSGEPRLYGNCQISLLILSVDFHFTINPAIMGRTEIISTNYSLFSTPHVRKVP
jgi:hypothetical protein